MTRAKDSWWELSVEERSELGGKVREYFEKVGGKPVISASCEWSNPKYPDFGVQEFPSVAALRQHFEDQRELGFLQHLDGEYVVGTPWEDGD
jgi:hypothetical protein